MAPKEGIFTGISGGGTFAGALKVCADAGAQMNEAELAIMQSTPGHHLAPKT